jgi:radical SAM protein with 4Fe4S-binding SPASM domain
MKPPADAIIAVTHRCNSRCVTCNVWKSTEQDLLLPEHMRKLPPELATINLTGGEPFLRADLGEFVRQARARCPHARITISTNAYLVERIAEMMGGIRRIDPSIRLAVSLDGIGAAHDRVRGREGAFDAAVSLIDRLSADGFRGLRLGMTLSGANLGEFLAVAELAARRRLELGVVAAHGARTHLGIDHPPMASAIPSWLREHFQRILGGWLRSWRGKQWLRAHFAYNTYRYLAGRRWRFRCHAGSDFFFLQADGKVYSCSVQGKEMGSIITQEWEEIWNSPAADEGRGAAHLCPESCWMICTARAAYRAHPVRVAAWVLGRKVLAHLRRFRLPTEVGDQDAAEETRADTPH